MYWSNKRNVIIFTRLLYWNKYFPVGIWKLKYILYLSDNVLFYFVPAPWNTWRKKHYTKNWFVYQQFFLLFQTSQVFLWKFLAVSNEWTILAALLFTTENICYCLTIMKLQRQSKYLILHHTMNMRKLTCLYICVSLDHELVGDST